MPASKLAQWKPHEDELLRLNAGKIDVAGFASRLGRTPGAIRCRAWLLGLSPSRRPARRFTAEDDARIRQLAGSVSLAELARILDRRQTAVCYRANRLGCSTRKKRPPGEYLFNGDRRQHICIMEEFLGRRLHPGEVVHHINFNKHDNRRENLHLFADGAAHNRAHGSLDRLLSGLLQRNIVRFSADEGLYVFVDGGKQ